MSNQSIKSINQPTNQSINQSISQSINQINPLQKLHCSCVDKLPGPTQVGEKVRTRFFIDDNACTTDTSTFDKRTRNIVRHEFNGRKQSGVRKAYIASVKSRGIVESVRGEPWLVQPQDAGMPYRALSFASLCEAYYAALVEDPANQNLLVSLVKGLECRILDRRLPASIAKYLINMHNRFHSGSSTSFVELVQLVPDATWII